MPATATVRVILAPPVPNVLLTVIDPPTNPQVGVGCVVLVQKDVPPGEPLGTYYEVHAYIGMNAGPTAVMLPLVGAGKKILLLDLPHGLFTPPEEFKATLDAAFQGGPPSGVGPTSPAGGVAP